MKVCFFTGHRAIRKSDYAAVKSFLRAEILEKINSGVTVFIAGGAKGFDTLAAEQVIDIRQDYDIIKLHLYLPCNDQDLTWNDQEKKQYQTILKKADSIFYVSDVPYKKGCMEKRNRAMVEVSDCGIAYMTRQGSGSAQTVRMAEEKGIEVTNISKHIKPLTE